MRVYASSAFRYAGIDYPFGWQDLPQTLADNFNALGLVAFNDNLVGGGVVSGAAGSSGGSAGEITLSTTDWAANRIALQAAINANKILHVVGDGIYPIKGGPVTEQSLITVPSDHRVIVDCVIDNLGSAAGYPKTLFSNVNSTSNAIAVTNVTSVENVIPNWYSTVAVNIGAVANPFAGGDYMYIRPAYSAGDTSGFYNYIYRVVSVDNTDPANKLVKYEIPDKSTVTVPAPIGALIVYKADSNIIIKGSGAIRKLNESPRDESHVYGKLAYIETILNKVINCKYSLCTTENRGATAICYGNAFNSLVDRTTNLSGFVGIQVYGAAYGIEINASAGQSGDDLVALFTNGSHPTNGGHHDADGTNNSNGKIHGVVIDFKGRRHTNCMSRSVLLHSNNSNMLDGVVVKNLTAMNFSKNVIQYGTDTTGKFGKLTFKDSNLYPRISAKILDMDTTGGVSFDIEEILLDNVNVPGGSGDGNVGLCNGAAGADGLLFKLPNTPGTIVVDKLTMKNCNIMFDTTALSTATTYGVFLEGRSIINKISVDKCNFVSTDDVRQVIVFFTNNNATLTGVKEFTARDSHVDVWFGTLFSQSATATIPTKVFIDNVKPSARMQQLVSSLTTGSTLSAVNCDYSLAGNGLVNVSGATVRTYDFYFANNKGGSKKLCGAAIGTNLTLNIRSGGGNVAGSWAVGGTGNAYNFIGNCEDLQVDISGAGVNRVDGARVWNTNTAAGTINAVGPVYCQGTAALSWKRPVNATTTIQDYSNTPVVLNYVKNQEY